MFSSRTCRLSLAVARRSFATDAAHKPPLDFYGIQARYANATYTAASKANALAKVEQELLALRQTAESNTQFKDFLQNPLIARNEKVSQVEKLLKGKFSPTTVNLMSALAGNARLSELDKIVTTYVELMKAKRGQVEAVIISSEPLSKAQTDAVAAAMKNQVPEGKQVVLSSKVDPTILGGLQVQIGDKFLDLSVASRIDEISRISV